MPKLLSLNKSLAALNTLALPAQAAAYVKISTPDQLANLRQLVGDAINASPCFVLGGGSNLVITDDIPCLVLHMAILGKKLIHEDSEAWYIQAGAGEAWHPFVQWTLNHGYAGLENLALIPGTVGASPIQNIGAYGAELNDYFYQATAWDSEQCCWRQFTQPDCRFAYRDSVFKQEGWHLTGRMIITDVVFRLPKIWQANIGYGDIARQLDVQKVTTPTAQAIANAVIAIRQCKLPDPANTPNAGSFFQNPLVSAEEAISLQKRFPAMPNYPQANGQVKLAAGWLIEQAGWKGKSLGPVGMYAKQALVLVNHGGATGQDVRATMHAVQDEVFSRFQVMLQPEPVFIPA